MMHVLIHTRTLHSFLSLQYQCWLNMTEVFPQMLSKHSDPPPDGQASPLLASFVTLFIHLPDVHDAVCFYHNLAIQDALKCMYQI